jgi:histidyl-tRNA synthetase
LRLDGPTIKLNNRKILSGIAELIGAKDQLIQFTVALDKLDKIGEEGVIKEMLGHGISEAAIEKLKPLFALDGDSMVQLETLATMLQDSDEGTKGVEELRFILEHSQTLGLQNCTLALDVTLARGLNYYTGAIFEVSAPEGVKMGSIGGGGRYDDLTGIFGLKNVSGVGISFGLDRIYLVLEELGLFPESVSESLQVLCINFGDAEALASMQLIKQLREAGVACELYPSNAKMNKQMKYANARQVPFVVMIGDQELSTKNFVVKEMGTGTQSTYDLNDINPFLEALR